MRTSVHRFAAGAAVVLALSASAGCGPSTTAPRSPEPYLKAEREAFLAADASPEEVARVFVESLGNGEVDKANALYVGAVFRETDEPSADLAEIEAGTPASAQGLDPSWPVQVMYTVTYTANTGSKRFPKGDGRIAVTVVQQGEGEPWVVSGIRQ